MGDILTSRTHDQSHREILRLKVEEVVALAERQAERSHQTAIRRWVSTAGDIDRAAHDAAVHKALRAALDLMR